MAILISLIFLSGAHAAGLGELMEIASAQKDAQRTYTEETKAFNRVKAAIDDGTIKVGITQKEVKRRYGEPVVSMTDSATGREKWAYKPAKSSFFSGIKIYLCFDKDKNLDEIRVVE